MLFNILISDSPWPRYGCSVCSEPVRLSETTKRKKAAQLGREDHDTKSGSISQRSSLLFVEEPSATSATL